jgi:hypothetical protein
MIPQLVPQAVLLSGLAIAGVASTAIAEQWVKVGRFDSPNGSGEFTAYIDLDSIREADRNRRYFILKNLYTHAQKYHYDFYRRRQYGQRNEQTRPFTRAYLVQEAYCGYYRSPEVRILSVALYDWQNNLVYQREFQEWEQVSTYNPPPASYRKMICPERR